MSEAVRTLFFETADKEGWLRDRDLEKETGKAKGIAKNLLSLDVPIEKIVKATGLTVEVIRELA